MAKSRIGWALWLIAVFALWFFENNPGTLAALVLSALLPTLSMALCALSARRARLEWDAPASLLSGERGYIRCRVTGFFPATLFHWEAEVERFNPLTCARSGERLPLPDGRGGFFAESGCGTLQTRTTGLWAADWFFLVRLASPARAGGETLILPRLRAVPEEGGGSPIDRSAAEPGAEVREYRAGDPVRQIHWKLSAKLDRTMLREEELPEGEAPRLLLETAPPVMDGKAMDAAVEAFCSLSWALAEAGRPHQALWYDHGARRLNRMEVEGPGDFAAMRDMLLRSASHPGGKPLAPRLAADFPGEDFAGATLFSADAPPEPARPRP